MDWKTILEPALVATQATLHRWTAFAIPFAIEFNGIPAEILLGAAATMLSYALDAARMFGKPWYPGPDRPSSCSRTFPLSSFF